MGTPCATLIACLLTLLTAMTSCVSTGSADLMALGQKHGMLVSCDSAPEGSEPLALVATQTDGFYLFGYFPLAPVSMERCVHYIVNEARSLGADGIACVEFDYQPADALKFSVFPLPDWTARIAIRGMAWRWAQKKKTPTGPR